MSSSVLPLKSFIVSGLTFRSLIHFEFIFVYGVRKCSNFILLHRAVQFSQQHLIDYLCPLYIFASFDKGKVPICVWIYLWAFCLVPLVYISVLCQYHTDKTFFLFLFFFDNKSPSRILSWIYINQ